MTDPTAILSALFSTGELRYAVWLGVPLAGLFLLAPAAGGCSTATARRERPVAVTSDDRPQTPVHRSGGAVPDRGDSVRNRAPAGCPTRAPAGIVLGLCLVVSLLVGAWPAAPGATSLWYQKDVPAARIAALDEAVRLVPDDAPVSATNKAGSHMSARRYFYSVPVLERSEWIVLDMADPWIAGAGSPVLGPHPNWLRQFRQKIERDSGWTKVFDEEGVLVFRRTES